MHESTKLEEAKRVSHETNLLQQLKMKHLFDLRRFFIEIFRLGTLLELMWNSRFEDKSKHGNFEGF